MTQPTFILVHGAWHGAWSWRDLGAEFDRRGVTWRALNLPSSQRGGDPLADLDQDAVRVADACEVDGDVVLVGHSYGGAVISEAAHLVTNLERMVYVAALVPEVGQSATDASREVRVRTELDAAMELDGDYIRLDPTKAASALYHDCTREVSDWATAQLSVQTLASFRSARKGVDVPVPSRYILCRQDRAIDPALQQVMARRTNEVIAIESGHCPFLSRPSQLCEILLASSTDGARSPN
ncbi:MAG TPA: alpha/beta fold hydrolase [Acidimicrobiales bacterium]|nr:alpha/beta fold hydrolase [Acidimicrobiales bacterium]